MRIFLWEFPIAKGSSYKHWQYFLKKGNQSSEYRSLKRDSTKNNFDEVHDRSLLVVNAGNPLTTNLQSFVKSTFRKSLIQVQLHYATLPLQPKQKPRVVLHFKTCFAIETSYKKKWKRFEKIYNIIFLNFEISFIFWHYLSKKIP